MAGLVAAVMSHISGAVNSCSTIAAMDFYVPIRDWLRRRKAQMNSQPEPEADPERDDRNVVFFGRMFGIFTILLEIFWARIFIEHSDRPIFIYIFNAYGYFTPGIVTMFLMGIFWRRTTGIGALAAGVLTIPLSVAVDMIGRQLYGGPIPFQNRTGIVFWLCMVICALVSLCTKPKDDEELKGLIWSPDSFRLPKGDKPLAWYARPVVWWALITCIVICCYIVYA